MILSFKRTDTGNNFKINIDNNFKIKDLRNLINNVIIDNLNLSEYVIIKTNVEFMENGGSIDESSELSIDKYTGYNDYYAFYIRPGNNKEIIPHEYENCCICYNNFRYFENINRLNCSHSRNFCQNCFNNWKSKCIYKNKEFNCPLCRNNIN